MKLSKNTSIFTPLLWAASYAYLMLSLFSLNALGAAKEGTDKFVVGSSDLCSFFMDTHEDLSEVLAANIETARKKVKAARKKADLALAKAREIQSKDSGWMYDTDAAFAEVDELFKAANAAEQELVQMLAHKKDQQDKEINEGEKK